MARPKLVRTDPVTREPHDRAHLGFARGAAKANGSGAFGGISACACALMRSPLKNVKRSSFRSRKFGLNSLKLHEIYALRSAPNRFQDRFQIGMLCDTKAKPPNSS